MAKKKLTPRQQEWETEYKKLQRRVRDWKCKFHAVPEMPQKPKRITKQAIESLKHFKWRNISEEKKKQWRKEYEIQYENREPSVYTPKPQYTPPTEQEFLDNLTLDELEHEKQFLDPDYDEPDEDGYTETVISRDEIEAWFDRTIDTIVVEHELDGVREQLRNLVMEAADAYGDYNAYLSYLESQAGALTELATKALFGYIDKNGKVYQHDESALPQFATVLNLGRPLDQSQSERLDFEGWVSFDFNDL